MGWWGERRGVGREESVEVNEWEEGRGGWGSMGEGV